MKPFPFCLVILLLVLSSCTGKRPQETSTKNLIPYSIKKIFPHDNKAFTQGLTVADGKLFESTGQANSWIAEVDVATGIQDKKIVLDKKQRRILAKAPRHTHRQKCEQRACVVTGLCPVPFEAPGGDGQSRAGFQTRPHDTESVKSSNLAYSHTEPYSTNGSAVG